MPERRLYHPRAALDTLARRLLAHRLNLKLIRDRWDDLVRCAASLRDGTVTASLLIGRLQAASSKLPLTRALQEYGRLVKTRFVLGYLADETERRAIGRQLNKAEALHALHDRLFHGHHGTIRLHMLERQSTQAHCLHLVANAVIYWNTIYTQLALDDLPGQPADDELAGLSPTQFEHVNPLGTYTFNVEPLDHEDLLPRAGLLSFFFAWSNGGKAGIPPTGGPTRCSLRKTSQGSRGLRRPPGSLWRRPFWRSGSPQLSRPRGRRPTRSRSRSRSLGSTSTR